MKSIFLNREKGLVYSQEGGSPLHRDLTLKKQEIFLSIYLIITTWLIMGAITAYLAKKRDRNPIAWFFIGVFLGILGVVILLFLPQKQGETTVKPAPASIQASTYHPLSMPEELPFESQPPRTRLSQNPKIHWYFIDQNKSSQGPLSFDAFKNAYKNGVITPATMIWNEEIEQWTLLKSFSNYHIVLQD